MKIVYVTDTILDPTVVHATHIDEVCKNFVALGHSVTLFAPLVGPRMHASYKIVFIRTLKHFITIPYQIRLYFQLRKFIATEHPDCIYCRMGQLLVVPAIVSRHTSVPIFFEVNGKLLEETKQKNTHLLFKLLQYMRVYTRIERFNVHRAAGCIAVSEGIKDDLLHRYALDPSAIAVIANGVNVEEFKPVDISAARAITHLEADRTYIGYIGSLHIWQGLQYVAQAIPLVVSRFPNTRFIFIGNGAQKAWISSFIAAHHLEEYVEIRPGVAHLDIPAYIQSMDICVSYPLKLRSNAASPFKVYEYVACGKPVVVSDIGGIREEFGSAVLYACPEKPSALAAQLCALLGDASKRNQLSIAARAFIEHGHSWKSVTEKICAFLQLSLTPHA